MHKYTRYDQPLGKNQWLNSSIKMSLDSTGIKINKQPQLNKMLSGILELSDRPSSNSIFQTKSVFATNVPSYSAIPSNPIVRRRETNTGRNERQERITTCFASRRAHSEKRIRGFSNQGLQRMKSKKIDNNNLKDLVLETKKYSGRVLNVLLIVRNGLRYDLKQTYVGMEDENTKSTAIKDIKAKIKQNLQLDYKNIYMFHLNREPISKLLQIHSSEHSIFIDKSPKLNIPLELYSELNDQIKMLERKIKTAEDEVLLDDSDEENIVDIAEYADQLIDDPTAQIQIHTKFSGKFKNKSEQFKKILNWYDNGIQEFNNRTSDRGSPLPSMDQKSHPGILKQTRVQLESFPYINNPHKVKYTTEEIRQKEFQLKNRSKSHSKISTYISQLKTSKEINRQLINKNSLLSSQNIPYLIQKYNISRVQIHNLYNLYKSLAQVSALRNKSSSELTLQRGIDRTTFDDGLSGLGYNIGKEVVRTICNFQSFVSWPQFLKIVSISSSKTPEEKLQSILKYVSQDSNSQYLNQLQVDIMVSACLSKFLGKTEENDFIQMKEYLLDTIFKQLDPTNQKKIKISTLKERVLREGRENDLISFLFLYSD